MICSADCRIKILPTSVEPVKVSFLMAGFEQNSCPINDDFFEVITEKTPFGTPALSASNTIARAESGVSVAGLETNEHPAASAGATFLVIIAFGKFQGVIDATTPTGCFITIILLST
jgi:hypothetical protein